MQRAGKKTREKKKRKSVGENDVLFIYSVNQKWKKAEVMEGRERKITKRTWSV